MNPSRYKMIAQAQIFKVICRNMILKLAHDYVMKMLYARHPNDMDARPDQEEVPVAGPAFFL